MSDDHDLLKSLYVKSRSEHDNSLARHAVPSLANLQKVGLGLQDEAAEVLREAEDTTEGLKTQVSSTHMLMFSWSRPSIYTNDNNNLNAFRLMMSQIRWNKH